MMNKRIVVVKRATNGAESFGKSGQPKFEYLRQAGDHGFWAAESFNRGTKSLREGALDAYDVVMFRMDYHEGVDRWCLIKYHGKWYQILSCNADFQADNMQITAQELANQQVNIIEPYNPSSSEISGGSSTEQPIGE